MQADVWILDTSIDRMRELDPMLDGRATIAMSNTLAGRASVGDADLVIGAVLVPGARAPKLVTREMLGLMRPGAVLVDVAIDQGGCFETSHPTTHSAPTYDVDGIVHYCVANMPGAVPITSTRALTNATLPYIEQMADHGFGRVGLRSPALRGGSASSTARSPRNQSPRRSAPVRPACRARRPSGVVSQSRAPIQGSRRARHGPRKKEKSMSSDTSRTYRRPHLGRMRRAALTAVAVVVGAIVLSGCVVIQSESAVQANVIGNSVTVTTVLCASNASSPPPCNSPGNQNQYAGAVRLASFSSATGFLPA